MPASEMPLRAGEITATLGNTRRIAFALWWKLVLIVGLCGVGTGFLSGWVSAVLPWGQLTYWVATSIMHITPEAWWPVLAALEPALSAAIPLAIDIVLIFAVINCLLARHIGRDFRGYRLVLLHAASSRD